MGQHAIVYHPYIPNLRYKTEQKQYIKQFDLVYWTLQKASLISHRSERRKAAQQSVHLTLGILRSSQAVSHALAFFWLDGFAVPAPAQVTQAVRRRGWARGQRGRSGLVVTGVRAQDGHRTALCQHAAERMFTGKGPARGAGRRLTPVAPDALQLHGVNGVARR